MTENEKTFWLKTLSGWRQPSCVWEHVCGETVSWENVRLNHLKGQISSWVMPSWVLLHWIVFNFGSTDSLRTLWQESLVSHIIFALISEWLRITGQHVTNFVFHQPSLLYLEGIHTHCPIGWFPWAYFIFTISRAERRLPEWERGKGWQIVSKETHQSPCQPAHRYRLILCGEMSVLCVSKCIWYIGGKSTLIL